MIKETRTYTVFCDQCGHEEPAADNKPIYPAHWYHVTLEQQHRHGHGWFCTMPCVIHWVKKGKTSD